MLHSSPQNGLYVAEDDTDLFVSSLPPEYWSTAMCHRPESQLVLGIKSKALCV